MIKSCNIKHQKLNIVEGVYSLHPHLFQYYDYKIFLSVDSNIQIERIKKRNSEKTLQRFINEWIPKEEEYFNYFKTQERCDISFDTTNLF